MISEPFFNKPPRIELVERFEGTEWNKILYLNLSGTFETNGPLMKYIIKLDNVIKYTGLNDTIKIYLEK